MHEPQHQEVEARLVHVTEEVLGAREPREGLLRGLGVGLGPGIAADVLDLFAPTSEGTQRDNADDHGNQRGSTTSA